MTDDLITRLRGYAACMDIDAYASCDEAADALEAQARRIAELEAELETTKSLLPQKLVDAPYRPPFISDWWSIAVLERRKRRSADKELRARIAELTAALKPFSDIIVSDDLYDETSITPFIKVGDLRAARAALEKKE